MGPLFFFLFFFLSPLAHGPAGTTSLYHGKHQIFLEPHRELGSYSDGVEPIPVQVVLSKLPKSKEVKIHFGAAKKVPLLSACVFCVLTRCEQSVTIYKPSTVMGLIMACGSEESSFVPRNYIATNGEGEAALDKDFVHHSRVAGDKPLEYAASVWKVPLNDLHVRDHTTMDAVPLKLSVPDENVQKVLMVPAGADVKTLLKLSAPKLMPAHADAMDEFDLFLANDNAWAAVDTFALLLAGRTDLQVRRRVADGTVAPVGAKSLVREQAAHASVGRSAGAAIVASTGTATIGSASSSSSSSGGSGASGSAGSGSAGAGGTAAAAPGTPPTLGNAAAHFFF